MINPWLLERVDMRYATGLCYPQLHRVYRVVTGGRNQEVHLYERTAWGLR